MGMPAARITDMHVCPLVNGLVPHVGGPISGPCMPPVLIGGLPAARVTDMAVCVGPPDMIARGSATVLIGGLMAARLGDQTAHGGVIVFGWPTVLIGDVGGGGSAAPGGGGAAPAVSTGLGEDIDAIAAKSPTLQKNLAALKGKVDIEYGTAGGGTFYDPNGVPRPKIVVDPNEAGDPASVVQSLSHESGHALYTQDPYVPPDGLTKEEYVAKNVNRNLKDEGEATLTNAQVRNEILENGGPDIGIAGSHTEEYDAIAKKYPDPADRDKARQEIGDIFADGETPSGDENAGKSYRDYYAKPYEDAYPQP